MNPTPARIRSDGKPCGAPKRTLRSSYSCSSRAWRRRRRTPSRTIVKELGKSAGAPSPRVEELQDRRRVSIDVRPRDTTHDARHRHAAPGAKLPAEFKRYMRRVTAAAACSPQHRIRQDDDDKLDIINGQVLDLPNRLLKVTGRRTRRCSASTTTGRSRRTTTGRRVTVGARAVQETLGLTGAGIGVAVIDSGITTLARRPHERHVEAVSLRESARRASSWTSSTAARCRTTTTATARTSPASSPATATTRRARRPASRPTPTLVVAQGARRQGQGHDQQHHRGASAGSRPTRKTYNIRVVNMSVGAAITESYWTDPLTLAVKARHRPGHHRGDRGRQHRARTRHGKPQYGAHHRAGQRALGGYGRRVEHERHADPQRRHDGDFSSRGPTYIDFDAKPDLVAPGTGTISLAAAGQHVLHRTKAAALLAGRDPDSAPSRI